MKKNDFLYANSYITHYRKKLLSAYDLDQLILIERQEELIQALQKHKYNVSNILTSREAIDTYIEQQTQYLYQEYKQHACSFLLEPFFIETKLLFEGSEKTYNYDLLKYYCDIQTNADIALKEYSKLKIDQTLIMLYLRGQKIEESYEPFICGNIDRDIFLTLFKDEKTIETILHTAYGSHFDMAIEEYKNHGKTFLMEQSFDEMIAKTMAKYRYTVIGTNGLFAYAYAKLEELKNIRMLLKARFYYMEKDIQKRMVRTPYV